MADSASGKLRWWVTTVFHDSRVGRRPPFPAETTRMAARLVPRRPAAAVASSLGSPSVLGIPEAACSTTLGTDATTTDALCSLRASLPASRCACPKPGPLDPLSHQRQVRSSPKAPYHRRVSPFSDRLAPPGSRRAATAAWLCHQDISFRRTFTALPSNR